MKPLVSIIVPMYNAAPYISETLESVVASTYRPIEVIVMDDGSTDDSLSIAQQFASSHTEVIVLSQPNAGASAARNSAIRASHGDYILPVDADDRIHPLYIEEAENILANRPEVRVVGCRAEFFGERTGEWHFPPFSKELLARKNMIGICSMYRRADWNQTPGYMETCAAREDWDLWLSLFEKGGDFVRLPNIRLYYRVRKNSKRIQDRALKRELINEINRRHPAYLEKYLGGPLHYHRSWSRFINHFRTVKQIGDFERWTDGEIIDARRNILRLTEGVVVKQFKTPNILRGIWYGWFGTSKARRSYENAIQLGSLTPAPIAYCEVRYCGILRESWYACQQSSCLYTFNDLIDNPLFPHREQILHSIGHFTAQLRAMGVWHRDYSGGNILFNEDGSKIEIIDLNRIRWRKHVPGKPFERLERIGEDGLKQLRVGYEQV